MSEPSCKIAVFISGGGSNLQSIIDHVKLGHINATIACVISNNPDAFGLTRAQQANIPTHIVQHNAFPSREAFDAELVKVLEVYKVKLIVLAGFMRILSPTFVNEYQGSVLNIHPSLLPKYTGLHTHARAIEAKDYVHGCSVHFVTAELDEGPLVIQAKVNVENSDTPEVLAERVLEKEHIIYPLAVKWFCEDRLQLKDNTIYFDGSPIEHAIELNATYEKELQ